MMIFIVTVPPRRNNGIRRSFGIIRQRQGVDDAATGMGRRHHCTEWGRRTKNEWRGTENKKGNSSEFAESKRSTYEQMDKRMPVILLPSPQDDVADDRKQCPGDRIHAIALVVVPKLV